MGNRWKCCRSGKTKGAQTQTLGSGYLPRGAGGGGLPHEGVGAKKFGMSLETQGNQLFSGTSRDFCSLLGGPLVGHPQTCVYPDVCLGIAHVSGKVPLSGQWVWQIHNVSAPFAPRNLQAERDRYIVYLPDPLSRERDFTRYLGNP